MIFHKQSPAQQPVQKRFVFGAKARAVASATAKPASASASAESAETQRIDHPSITRRLTRDLPPNIPFLRFDAIAGRGGMATVWRAWHRELNRNVAVKVLDRDFASSGEDVRRFMMEVRAMTDLTHPGIVKGYGADCADGRYFFIMDYVDGYTFGSLLNRKAHLPEIDAIIIGESVSDAMAYAWNLYHVIHCDLKPDNIMVDVDGTVKVTDLGLCQMTSAIKNGTEGQSEEVLGTPAYISPEQVLGDVELDCRSDIYSLGATLYHLTTGRMLFQGLSSDDMLRAHVDPNRKACDPRILVPNLSAGSAHWLAKMLAKNRDERYGSWEEVLADAQALETGGAILPLMPGVESSINLTEDPA